MAPKEKKTVLVVDDEPMDIQNTREILEGSGEYTILSAVDYHDALRVFQANADSISAALIDVALPGKNGVEVAKRLLSLKPDLRVVFVSGHVGASVIRFYGINAGNEHFLQKPFNRADLLAKLRYSIGSNDPLQFILSASSSGAGDDEPKEDS